MVKEANGMFWDTRDKDFKCPKQEKAKQSIKKWIKKRSKEDYKKVYRQ